MNLSSSIRMWAILEQHLLQLCVLVVAVAFLAKLFAKERAHLAHALWAIVILKCVTPPILSTPTSIFYWLERPTPLVMQVEDANSQSPSSMSIPAQIQKQSLNASRSDSDQASDELSAATPPRHTAHVVLEFRQTLAAWSLPLLSTWICGVVLTLAWVILKFRAFQSRLTQYALPISDPQVAHFNQRAKVLAERIGLRKCHLLKCRLLIVDAPIGPAVLGLFRPTILLPKIVVNASSSEQIDILIAHELVHIRRGDLLWAYVQALAVGIWWFLPLIRWSSKRMDEATERSCDEETIQSLGCTPTIYARSLVNVLQQKRILQGVPAMPGVRPVEVTADRLKRIMKVGTRHHAQRPWWSNAVLILGAFMTLPGAVKGQVQVDVTANAPVHPEPQTLEAKVEEPFSIEPRWIIMPKEILQEIKVDWKVPQSGTAISEDPALTLMENLKADSKFGTSTSINTVWPFLVCQVDRHAMKKIQEQASTHSRMIMQTISVPRIIVSDNQDAWISAEDWELKYRPQRVDGAINLNCELKLSPIERVKSLHHLRGSDVVDKVMKLPMPDLSGAKFSYVAKNLNSGDSLVIATLRPSVSQEVFIFVATVEEWGQERAAKEPPSLLQLLDRLVDKQEELTDPQATIPIMGPLVKHGLAKDCTPPSDAELTRAFEKLPQGRALRMQADMHPSKAIIRVSSERMTDALDPLRFVPLVGRAQLHHAYYRCTVTYMSRDQERQSPISESYVFTVDHQHFVVAE